MGWPEPGRGGRVPGLPQQPCVGADGVFMRLPQNGGVPLHSQYAAHRWPACLSDATATR